MQIQALPVPPSLLGESPTWWPEQGALYWTDIPGLKLHRWIVASSRHDEWAFETEVGSFAPLPGGHLLLALRSGLARVDPATGQRTALADAPYDRALLRFNDGKADPQGRFWVGTICEPRDPPRAALYRWAAGKLEAVAADISVSNGLGWSPDGRTMYWSDTHRHQVFAFDFDASEGTLSRRRVFASFARKTPGQDLATYGGRPDGAAVDAEGCYWVAMFEGQRLLRLAPSGEQLLDVPLPARCPTMPCFGGPDLRTLFVTTARANRPAEELAAQPLAGAVLTLRVEVPGLPIHFARG
ncbi:MAG: SMP-30/gluconolactonase/LRE family protein [Burkholderiales bacterium]|nr:SMP-30/gluconolactonase/LRE family protein [Burkholderiales bacterium]